MYIRVRVRVQVRALGTAIALIWRRQGSVNGALCGLTLNGDHSVLVLQDIVVHRLLCHHDCRKSTDKDQQGGEGESPNTAGTRSP